MAFNPFQSFRKHAKVYFAVLTIICMVTFILAWGQGDALTWITNQITGGGKGEVVTKLYGKKVHKRDLEIAVFYRAAVDDVVTRAIEVDAASAMNQAFALLQEDQPAAADEMRGIKSSLRMSLFAVVFDDAMERNDQERRALLERIADQDTSLRFPLNEAKRFWAEARAHGVSVDAMISRLDQQRFTLMFLASALQREQNVENADVVTSLSNRLGLRATKMRVGTEKIYIVFSGDGGTQDMLDFQMWLHQADELGIKITDSDLRTEINRLAPYAGILSGNTTNDRKYLRDLLGDKRQLELDELYKALRDELRVGIAKGVILGSLPGFWGETKSGARGDGFVASTGMTPADYLDYYREKRDEMKVVLLPIPIAAFIDSKAEPQQEQELLDLFARYRDRVPNPANPTPGFRDPDRTKLEWISAYRVSKETAQQAAQVIPLGGYLNAYVDPRDAFDRERTLIDLITQIAPRNPFTPLNVLNIVHSSNPASPLHLFSRADGEIRAIRFHYSMPRLLEADPALVFYSAANKPGVHASLTGHFVGSGVLSAAGGGNGAWIHAAAAAQNASVHQGTTTQEPYIKKERETRSRIFGQLVLGSITMPSLAAPAYWDYVSPPPNITAELPRDLPPRIPLEVIRGEVYDRFFEAHKQAILFSAYLDFYLALRDAKEDKRREVIDGAIKRNRWEATHGVSSYAADEFDIIKDPALRPLMPALEAFLAKRMEPGSFLFLDQTLFKPRDVSEQAGVPEIILWKTAFILGRTPQSIGEARQKVLDAWRENEARKAAYKKGVEIAQNVGNQKTPAEKLKVLEDTLAANPAWGKDRQLIPLDRVARMVKAGLSPLAGTREFEPYLSRLAREDFPNPPGDLVEELHKLTEGTAGVLRDRPERTVYVAYLEKRYPSAPIEQILKERETSQFWVTELSKVRAREVHEETIKELRREAGAVDARGRFVIKSGSGLEKASTESE